MARSLAIVAVTGIGVSIVCLSMAGTLYPGGSWLDGVPWHPGIWKDDGVVGTRDLEWRGGDIEVSIPAQVHFRRADGWRASVTGPQGAIGRLRIAGGLLRLAGPGGDGAAAIEVQLAGPAVGKVTVTGSGDVWLEQLDQPSLEVAVVGSGSVTATGAVRDLDVQVVGSGDADLGGLHTVDVDASILGSGDATVAPTGDARVRILGSGDLVLATKPRSLSSRVTGSGEVRETLSGD